MYTSLNNSMYSFINSALNLLNKYIEITNFGTTKFEINNHFWQTNFFGHIILPPLLNVLYIDGLFAEYIDFKKGRSSALPVV